MQFLRFLVLSVKIVSNMDKIRVSQGLNKYSDIFNLAHLKWPIDVRRAFILSLYGVSGVIIEYFAHNCRYFDFKPSETLILVMFGHFCSFRTQNPRN